MFTIIGMVTGVVMAVLITIATHAQGVAVPLLIGMVCGAVFTVLGIYIDSQR